MPMLVSGQILENYNPSIRVFHASDLYYSPERASIDINVKDFPLSEYKLQVPARSSVFLDNVLWFYAANDSVVQVETALLRQGEVTVRKLSIVKKDLAREDISILKGYFVKDKVESVPVLQEEYPISRRNKEVVTEFFYMALFIILFLLALFKIIYPLLFTLLMNPMSIFSSEDFSDNVTRPRIFSSDVIFYLMVFNMLFMLLIVCSVYYMDLPVLREVLKNELDFMFLIWLAGTVCLLILALVKLLWLKVSTAIYGIGRLEFIHFFYMLRIITFALLPVFLILTIVISNDLMASKSLMPYLLSMFFMLYIIGIAMLFFLMTKKVSFKNYHLFSYLCTAEVVPFLVIAKLIIG
ncbi:hypothetical protein EL17_15850 [Anditalea andensis]|uniref:DUF4271 domain-containing protein n=2 Tax=Anditalea andensis TaxID=1048983 RepID=A0A074KSZ8_9BACT|nr:hypothetical protein EL17_15850 [Anditalea andensis]